MERDFFSMGVRLKATKDEGFSATLSESDLALSAPRPPPGTAEFQLFL